MNVRQNQRSNTYRENLSENIINQSLRNPQKLLQYQKLKNTIKNDYSQNQMKQINQLKTNASEIVESKKTLIFNDMITKKQNKIFSTRKLLPKKKIKNLLKKKKFEIFKDEDTCKKTQQIFSKKLNKKRYKNDPLSTRIDIQKINDYQKEIKAKLEKIEEQKEPLTLKNFYSKSFQEIPINQKSSIQQSVRNSSIRKSIFKSVERSKQKEILIEQNKKLEQSIQELREREICIQNKEQLESITQELENENLKIQNSLKTKIFEIFQLMEKINRKKMIEDSRVILMEQADDQKPKLKSLKEEIKKLQSEMNQLII